MTALEDHEKKVLDANGKRSYALKDQPGTQTLKIPLAGRGQLSGKNFDLTSFQEIFTLQSSSFIFCINIYSYFDKQFLI